LVVTAREVAGGVLRWFEVMEVPGNGRMDTKENLERYCEAGFADIRIG